VYNAIEQLILRFQSLLFANSGQQSSAPMKNKLLYAILGLNAGVIGTIFFLFLFTSQLETGSSYVNYLTALGVGLLLGGIGYFVGGKMA
jgi:hypothetical protein